MLPLRVEQSRHIEVNFLEEYITLRRSVPMGSTLAKWLQKHKPGLTPKRASERRHKQRSASIFKVLSDDLDCPHQAALGIH